MISGNVESKTISVNFGNCITSKVTDMSYSVDGSFTHAYAYNIFIYHLENTSSVSNVFIPDFDLFHYTILYIYIYITTNLKSTEVLGSYQAHSGKWKFSKILIFTWNLKFLLLATGIIISYFPWNVRLTFFTWEMSVRYSSLNSCSLFKWKWWSMGKKASAVCKSLAAQVLSVQIVILLQNAAEMLYVYRVCIVSHTIWKRPVLRDCNLIKLIFLLLH